MTITANTYLTNNVTYDNIGTNFCKLCDQFAREFKANLSSIEKMGEFVNTYCSQNTFTYEVNESCFQLLSKYVPVISKVVVESIDPETICSKSILCTQTADPEKWPYISYKFEPDKIISRCMFCKKHLFYYNAVLRAVAVGYYNHFTLFADYCAPVLFDSRSTVCRTIARETAPFVASIILEKVGDLSSACYDTNLCNSQTLHCESCKNVVSILTKTLADRKMHESRSLSYCKDLLQDQQWWYLKSACEETCNKHFSEMSDIIVEVLDVDRVCQRSILCGQLIGDTFLLYNITMKIPKQYRRTDFFIEDMTGCELCNETTNEFISRLQEVRDKTFYGLQELRLICDEIPDENDNQDICDIISQGIASSIASKLLENRSDGIKKCIEFGLCTTSESGQLLVNCSCDVEILFVLYYIVIILSWVNILF